MTMLVTVKVNNILVKGDLRSIEHARLVHVIPSECVQSGALKVGLLKTFKLFISKYMTIIRNQTIIKLIRYHEVKFHTVFFDI